jgi:nucleoside diphosphate kinase
MQSINWSMLTRMPTKAHLYQHETHFREGLSDLEEVFGQQSPDILRRSALVIVKPDGLATAKLGPVQSFLADNDFRIVGAEPFYFDRVTGRELWRFQLTLATLDRLAVNDIVLQAGPSILLVLRSHGEHELPATVRLSSLKGKADVSEQLPGTLRNILRQPNRLCSMVHCADEPADLVRELGLLADPPTRRRLLTELLTGQITPADQELLREALRREASGGISLDSGAALRRVSEAVLERRAEEPAKAAVADVVLGHLEAMRRGERIAWRAFARQLGQLNVKVEQWDLAIVGSNFVVEDEPGGFKIIGNPDIESWRH